MRFDSEDVTLIVCLLTKNDQVWVVLSRMPFVGLFWLLKVKLVSTQYVLEVESQLQHCLCAHNFTYS